MAVAVKTPETRQPAAPASVQLRSLVGLVVLLAGLAAVFWALPTYLPEALKPLGMRENAVVAIVILVELVAAVGLVVLATVLLGAKVPGVRAGTFVTFGAILGILFLGSWFGGVVEWLTFDKNWFGSLGKPIGMGITAAFTGILAVMYLRWFFAKGTDTWLKGFEEGGWFSWVSYKPLQGLRVRRGTIIGLLLLGGAGVYSLVSHNSLAKYDTWSIGIPFTGTIPLGWEYKRGSDGKILVDANGRKEKLPAIESSLGDAGPLIYNPEHRSALQFAGTLSGLISSRDGFAAAALLDQELLKNLPKDEPTALQRKINWDGESTIPVDRWVLRDEINSQLNRNNFIFLNLDRPGDFGLKNGLFPRDKYDEKKRELEEQNLFNQIDEKKDTRDPVLAGNPSGRKDPDRLYAGDTLKFTPIPLLPQVRFTVPLLLTVLTLWLAWRLVNYPVFADFLIATEAELNKVSWTTRKRLFQDTIVVLVTVLLMAGFLLLVDLSCKTVLGSKWIGVIQFNADAEASKKSAGQKPW